MDGCPAENKMQNLSQENDSVNDYTVKIIAMQNKWELKPRENIDWRHQRQGKGLSKARHKYRAASLFQKPEIGKRNERKMRCTETIASKEAQKSGRIAATLLISRTNCHERCIELTQKHEAWNAAQKKKTQSRRDMRNRIRRSHRLRVQEDKVTSETSAASKTLERERSHESRVMEGHRGWWRKGRKYVNVNEEEEEEEEAAKETASDLSLKGPFRHISVYFLV